MSNQAVSPQSEDDPTGCAPSYIETSEVAPDHASLHPELGTEVELLGGARKLMARREAGCRKCTGNSRPPDSRKTG